MDPNPCYVCFCPFKLPLSAIDGYVFRDTELEKLGAAIEACQVTKDAIGWDLPELEKLVQETEGRESDSDDE